LHSNGNFLLPHLKVDVLTKKMSPYKLKKKKFHNPTASVEDEALFSFQGQNKM